jgi:RNA-directed DNA polymerase
MTADNAQVSAASVTWPKAEPDTLMARVLAPANLSRTYQRVVSNKVAPGADGMTVDQLADYVKQYWPILKARLLAGEYHPQGVRAVDIPKPKGGTRQLGIPSVVDRLIQQALLQQLTPIFDPLFRTTATVFVRADALIKPSKPPAAMWRRVAAGAWSSIWRSCLIGSTTTY